MFKPKDSDIAQLYQQKKASYRCSFQYILIKIPKNLLPF